MNIDREIQPIVKKLNDKGFTTRYSCAGHPNKPKLKRGYLVFKRQLNNHEVNQAKDILHSAGIKRVSAKIKRMRHGHVTYFGFPSQPR